MRPIQRSRNRLKICPIHWLSPSLSLWLPDYLARLARKFRCFSRCIQALSRAVKRFVLPGIAANLIACAFRTILFISLTLYALDLLHYLEVQQKTCGESRDDVEIGLRQGVLEIRTGGYGTRHTLLGRWDNGSAGNFRSRCLSQTSIGYLSKSLLDLRSHIKSMISIIMFSEQ